METSQIDSANRFIKFLEAFSVTGIEDASAAIGQKVVMTDGKCHVIALVTAVGETSNGAFPSIEISAKQFRGHTIEDVIFMGGADKWAIVVKPYIDGDPRILLRGLSITPLS